MNVRVLDGAMGTELLRRGVDTSLPLWSAHALVTAPDVVRAIHADYVQAGADLITTNTFRTHRRSLARGGLGRRARELTQLAVRLAREAVAGRRVSIAGSIAPLEDCYSPELVPPDAELAREHAEMAEHLASASVDLFLVETMNSIREARAAAQAAAETKLPVMVSFVVGKGGRPPGSEAPADAEITLLSGESIADAVAAVQDLEPAAILVNCVPLATANRAFEMLKASAKMPIGLYANVGHPDPISGWRLTDDVVPAAYARAACEWRARGATIIGGCCGTTPAHIAAVARALHESRGAP